MQLNLLTITKFLNDFDSATRYKLAAGQREAHAVGADAGLVRGRGQGDARGREPASAPPPRKPPPSSSPRKEAAAAALAARRSEACRRRPRSREGWPVQACVM